MDGRTAERLAQQYLLRRLPGFAAKKRVVCRAPIGWALEGFLFESTGHPGGRDFYFHVFVQLLWVARDYIVLSIGDRLGGGAHFWTLADDPGLTMNRIAALASTDGLRFLEHHGGPRLIKTLAERLREHPGDINVREELGGALLLTGRTDQALATLVVPDGVERDERDWAVEVERRCVELAVLARRDPAAAVARLAENRRQTLAALKLDREAGHEPIPGLEG